MTYTLAVVCLPMMFVLSSAAQTSANAPNELNLMPMPAQLERGQGQMPITQAFTVQFTGYKEPRLERAADRFMQRLFKQTGIPFIYGTADPAKPGLTVKTGGPSAPIQKVGEDESYVLEVTPGGATLTAANPLGVLRGMETFLQLVQETPTGFAAPAVNIHDKPRFPWRGTLIDVARHWLPPEVLERNLDGMAAAKLNVLHWHLSENQGFRVESKRYPKLQEMGSDGNYYTQEQVKGIIAYARDRGIRVVPEFDMPGHTTAWFVGYPQIASGPGPYQIERKWGIFDPAMDPTKESTYEFLDGFIGEMAALFPDDYFHIGGDEVNGVEWDANPQIQEFKRTHNLKDNHDLQAYFNQRLQKIVAKHGKTMVGWDEVLHPDLPKDIVVQSWRGQKSLAAAARQGYRGLLSFGYYLDLAYHADSHYQPDPLGGDAANLTPEQAARVLGGESALWSEWVSPETIDSRLWPRNLAVAERLWSPQDVKDIDSMYRRMRAVSIDLESAGLKHRSNYLPMLQRIAGKGYTDDLRIVADVVEPVKEYARGQQDPNGNQREPLNRLVDAARPESMTARDFNAAVDRLIAKTASDQDKGFIRESLVRWKGADDRLKPTYSRDLMKEVQPIAAALSQAASGGLQALDAIEKRGGEEPGGELNQEWKTEQLAAIRDAKKPQAQVLIMVLPGIEKLVQAMP